MHPPPAEYDSQVPPRVPHVGKPCTRLQTFQNDTLPINIMLSILYPNLGKPNLTDPNLNDMVLSERNSLYDHWVNVISYCLPRSDPIKGLSPLNQFIFKIQNINVGIWITLITQPFYYPHRAEPNFRTSFVSRKYGIPLSSF